jgi:hypothetical protein
MLTIRPYTESDLARLQQLHEAQGFSYQFPDLDKPEFVSKTVIENGETIEAALLLRKTLETYLLMPKMTRKEGLGRILIFEREILPLLKAMGFTDLHAWLPPEIDKRFGKLLVHLGWQKQLWPAYSREVK